MRNKSTESKKNVGIEEHRDRSIPVQWLGHRLMEKSTWSGVSLVVICVLVLLGLPIVKTVAWIGLLYGLYSIFSSD
ncbi:hypothetical protein [Methylocaldum sp.]|uniref:hypothetical protein n=1 Tax=Methylocaldum sp. TaxID=1969727 RepID=UPI002D56A816|nr:hypothetical protein [Methylocaldum sp.]HYE37401.1 hypothetical protein [Methylocaldum sp.]